MLCRLPLFIGDCRNSMMHIDNETMTFIQQCQLEFGHKMVLVQILFTFVS